MTEQLRAEPMRPALLPSVLAAVLVTMAAIATPAGAQPPSQRRGPVNVTVSGLFGDDVTPPQGWAPMLITLENRTERELSGVVHAKIRDWRNRGPEHRIPVDLPPRATRRVQLAMHVRDGGDVAVQFVDGGTELGAGQVGVGYNASARGIVVLSDPPRLRGALLDLQDEQPAPHLSLIHIARCGRP